MSRNVHTGFSKFDFVRISETFFYNNSELSTFWHQCYPVISTRKSNFEKTLYTFLDIGLFFYLKKTADRYLFYSLRNRFLTLQKSDFEKTKRHLCDMCERVWMWQKKTAIFIAQNHLKCNKSHIIGKRTFWAFSTCAYLKIDFLRGGAP